jgi:hypothetical protein
LGTGAHGANVAAPAEDLFAFASQSVSAVGDHLPMLLNGRTVKIDKTGSNSSANSPKDRERREDKQQREETSQSLPREHSFTGWGWDYYDDAIDPYPTTH